MMCMLQTIYKCKVAARSSVNHDSHLNFHVENLQLNRKNMFSENRSEHFFIRGGVF